MAFHHCLCKNKILSRVVPRICQRQIFTTVTNLMPRKARLKYVEEAEEEISTLSPVERWSDYAIRGRQSLDEVSNITSFGSIRLDTDNLPLRPTKQFLDDKLGSKAGHHSSEVPRSTSSNLTDYLGIPVDEQFVKYDKFSAFSAISKNSDQYDIDKKFAFDINEENSAARENPTIPVRFDLEDNNQSMLDPSLELSKESDLNYFDQIVFEESYTKFNPEAANIPRKVGVDESLGLSQTQTSEPDLNFFDKTYFSSGCEAIQINHTNVELEESNVPKRKDTKTVNKEAKTKEVLNQSEVNCESEQKPKTKKKKDKVRLSTEGTALEYVRKLRKQESENSTVPHPASSLGKNLQDRFIEATSNMQEASLSKLKGGESVDEEDSASGFTNYVDVKKYKPPELKNYTKLEVKKLLLSKILYNKHDVVALWKPYGLPMFLGNKFMDKTKRERFSLECFLPDIAAKVDCEKLYEVHRLDSTTTGVIIYAKTKEMELKLRKLFAERKVKKNYLAICNGTPQAESGIIDIPIGDTKLGDRTRKTLKPNYNASKIITNKKNCSMSSEAAVTEYSVLCTHGNSSFVSTNMESGRKHQIRIHLGLGLGTPILGDHKYSYIDQLGKPQKVMGDTLLKMKLRKSKSRHLPIYLHARRIIIPDVLPDGNNLIIVATLPHFFSKTLKKLKLKTKTF